MIFGSEGGIGIISVDGNSDTEAPVVQEVVSADEFLYQDARDREQRLKLQRAAARAQAEMDASAPKMNTASHMLVRRKVVSEVLYFAILHLSGSFRSSKQLASHFF